LVVFRPSGLMVLLLNWQPVAPDEDADEDRELRGVSGLVERELGLAGAVVAPVVGGRISGDAELAEPPPGW
jgi:hypothetical protein